MQRQLTDVLQEFLVIVKFHENKEKFVKEFEELNHLETIANLAERLPEELQEKIKAHQGKGEILKEVFDKNEYQAELTKVSHAAFKRFVDIASPLLKLEQKQKVVKLLQS